MPLLRVVRGRSSALILLRPTCPVESATTFPTSSGAKLESGALEPLQVFDKILLLLVAEAQLEECVVMGHHIEQRREAAVVIEPALLMRPEPRQWRGAVHVRRRAVRLERVDADLGGRVQVVARLGEERRHVAARAPRLAVEQRLAAARRRRTEGAGERLRCGDGQLIEMQSRELRGQPVGHTARVAGAAPRRNWVLVPAAQPDRKSTRLNSSHRCISYAVFCLKKKKKKKKQMRNTKND